LNEVTGFRRQEKRGEGEIGRRGEGENDKKHKLKKLKRLKGVEIIDSPFEGGQGDVINF
jgi:hypothetical protein